MSTVVSVENVSKLYHIVTTSLGAANGHTRSLGETLTKLARNPLSVMRRNGHGEVEELWALKDLSFSVQEGEIVGIIGKNGAGKSTLLKLLSRVTEPTSGRITIKGKVGSLIEVGTGFHPELSGRENVFLNGAILGMKRSEIKQKFDQIVAFSGVERFLDTAVKHYSTGMYMRLAFSVAAHLEPDILIVDEILSVGDADFQKKCLAKIGDLAGSGRTILYVSHSLSSVSTLCSRAMLLVNGQKVMDGTAAAVVETYLARTIGVPMAEFASPQSAPGTDRLRLRSVRLLNEAGEVSGSFGMDDSIYVEITYWLRRPGLETNVGCQVLNSQGVLAFASNDFHDSEWVGRPKDAGLYRSICKIPGMFLNRGAYSLTIVVSHSYSFEPPDILEKEIVSFELLDNGTSALRGRYTGEWYGGIMRPNLPWETVRLSDKD